MEETANANANIKSTQNNCEMCHFSGEVLVHVSKAPSVSMSWEYSTLKGKYEGIRIRSCFDQCCLLPTTEATLTNLRGKLFITRY